MRFAWRPGAIGAAISGLVRVLCLLPRGLAVFTGLPCITVSIHMTASPFVWTLDHHHLMSVSAGIMGAKVIVFVGSTKSVEVRQLCAFLRPVKTIDVRSNPRRRQFCRLWILVLALLLFSAFKDYTC